MEVGFTAGYQDTNALTGSTGVNRNSSLVYRPAHSQARRSTDSFDDFKILAYYIDLYPIAMWRAHKTDQRSDDGKKKINVSYADI